MLHDETRSHEQASPFDPFIVDALRFVHRQGDIPLTELASRCAVEFNWLPGFAEVIVSFLRVNRLITLDPWEPGSLQLAARGQRWLADVTAEAVLPE
ncbi:MAG TPA: hypothetical protein PK819_03105 [Thermomicrobiales bacterium]|nr:hypothetical protein [Thermomicrobiales bacterium]